MKSFQVIRTHLSPYQGQDFTDRERLLLEELPEINYVSLAEASLDRPAILITNTHTQLAQIPPALLSNTQLIIHPNSGYDHFAAERPIWQNIPLVVGHTIRAQAVAEYTLGCLFQGTQEIPQHLSWDKNRHWSRSLLHGMPVWIFGYGHIGKKVADTLAILGAAITVVDPYLDSCPHKLLRHWEQGDLSQARALLLCCSLNASSYHLFDQKLFSEVHEKVLIINGARGKLIEANALREYLQSHPDSFAFLDVFEQEPFGEEWHHYPQVWKTSHIAGVHHHLDHGILDFTFSTLKDFTKLSPIEFSHKYKNELLQNKWKAGILI